MILIKESNFIIILREQSLQEEKNGSLNITKDILLKVELWEKNICLKKVIITKNLLNDKLD